MLTRIGLVAKKGSFRLKMTTRIAFVAQKGSISPQNDDENRSR
ncbi:hypothetical protein NSQ45_09805 [Caldifermentibacillus hisashii]